MCTVPPAYATTLTNAGTCPLIPTLAGWDAAEQNGGVPHQAGTSVLLGRSAPDQPWKAVFFTSSDTSLHDRWFTQRGNTSAHRFCWDQTAPAAVARAAGTGRAWCCLHAQVTALAGAPPIPPPLGPCLLAHAPGQHAAGNWEFSIRWWAAAVPPDTANARTFAFQGENIVHLAERWGLRGFGLATPARLSQRLAAITPCGCP